MIHATMDAKSNPDVVLLEQCESIISHGLRELMKIERAFSIIEKHQLYKQKHHDFEHYCMQKWSVQKEIHYLCCFQKNIVTPT